MSAPNYLTRDFAYEGQRHLTRDIGTWANHGRRYLTQSDLAELRREAMRRRKFADAGIAPSQQRPTPKRQDVWYNAKTGSQVIEGICSSDALNSHGEVWLSSGMECGGLPIPLMWDHKTEIGEIVWIKRLSSTILCRALVDEAETYVWRAIRAGELNAFSVAINRLSTSSQADDGTRVVDRWRLREISIVPEPANEECRFTILKRQPIRLGACA